MSCGLTAVDVGISVLMDIVGHGTLNVGKTWRLDCQNLEKQGLLRRHYKVT